MTLEAEWTPPQQLLADLAYRAWHPEPMSDRIRWPTFYYVAHEMRVRHDLDACEVLESFPVLGTVGIGPVHYSTVFFDRLDPTNPEALVGLTVAGLARAASLHQDPAGIFLALLAHAGDRRRAAVVDPYDPQLVTITDQTFSRACCTVSPSVSTAMYELICQEPSAVTGLIPHHHNPADGSWTAAVGLPALRFAGGVTLDAYLARIDAHLCTSASAPRAPRDNAGVAVQSSPWIDAAQAQGVMIGDGGTQNNFFVASTSTPPIARPTPGPTTNPWIRDSGSLGIGTAPTFPETLPGWTLNSSWHALLRAFDHAWTSVPGPDHSDFPATMNGCNTQRFLVRWRAINENSLVEVQAIGDPSVEPRTGSSGWMVLNGCQAPQIRLVDSIDGSTLSDVAVAVQQWWPSP